MTDDGLGDDDHARSIMLAESIQVELESGNIETAREDAEELLEAIRRMEEDDE